MEEDRAPHGPLGGVAVNCNPCRLGNGNASISASLASVDFDTGYKTMDKNFMESVWWVFKQCFDKGLIYQGYRIQPYSPALATPLCRTASQFGSVMPKCKHFVATLASVAFELRNQPGL